MPHPSSNNNETNNNDDTPSKIILSPLVTSQQSPPPSPGDTEDTEDSHDEIPVQAPRANNNSLRAEEIHNEDEPLLIRRQGEDDDLEIPRYNRPDTLRTRIFLRHLLVVLFLYPINQLLSLFYGYPFYRFASQAFETLAHMLNMQGRSPADKAFILIVARLAGLDSWIVNSLLSTDSIAEFFDEFSYQQWQNAYNDGRVGRMLVGLGLSAVNGLVMCSPLFVSNFKDTADRLHHGNMRVVDDITTALNIASFPSNWIVYTMATYNLPQTTRMIRETLRGNSSNTAEKVILGFYLIAVTGALTGITFVNRSTIASFYRAFDSNPADHNELIWFLSAAAVTTRIPMFGGYGVRYLNYLREQRIQYNEDALVLGRGRSALNLIGRNLPAVLATIPTLFGFAYLVHQAVLTTLCDPEKNCHSLHHIAALLEALFTAIANFPVNGLSLALMTRNEMFSLQTLIMTLLITYIGIVDTLYLDYWRAQDNFPPNDRRPPDDSADGYGGASTGHTSSSFFALTDRSRSNGNSSQSYGNSGSSANNSNQDNLSLNPMSSNEGFLALPSSINNVENDERKVPLILRNGLFSTKLENSEPAEKNIAPVPLQTRLSRTN